MKLLYPNFWSPSKLNYLILGLFAILKLENITFFREGVNTLQGRKMGLHTLTFALLVIGGLNWLLVGIFKWDVGQIFGGMEAIVSRLIYILVGLSAIYEVFSHKSRCAQCNPSLKGSMPSGSTTSM